MEAKWEENDVKCFDFANGSASPAPKANKGLVKAKFYTEMANAKNAPALGVRVNAVVLLLGFMITPVKEECGLAVSFGQ